MRARVSATAAPGSAAVASNAESGNSIRIATVVGATEADSAMPAISAPSTLIPMAAVGAAAATAAGAAARSMARPQAPLLITGLGDDTGQPAADAQLRCVFESQHRCGVTV